MEERITALCQNFIENETVIKKASVMESSLIYPIAANALCAQGVTADEAKLKECYRIINRQSGLFPYLNGIVTTPFAVNLSMKEDSKAAFDYGIDQNAKTAAVGLHAGDGGRPAESVLYPYRFRRDHVCRLTVEG